MTSYLHLYITNKYCALKRLMHGKRILSYTTRIFPSRRLKRKVSGPFTERFYYPNGGLNNGKSRCTARLACICGPVIFFVQTLLILQTFQHPLKFRWRYFWRQRRKRKKVRITIKYTLRSGGPYRKILRPKAEGCTQDWGIVFFLCRLSQVSQ